MNGIGSDRTEHFVFLDLPGATTVWLCSCTGYYILYSTTVVHEVTMNNKYSLYQNIQFIGQPNVGNNPRSITDIDLQMNIQTVRNFFFYKKIYSDTE